MIEELRDIPTLPQVTVELVRHLFQEEPDIQRVASIIEKESSLTAKLFSTVNSAAFGLRARVTSISQAISMMGLERLKSTIIAIALGEYFIQDSFGNNLDAKRFCLHSLASAVTIRDTAIRLGIKEGEQLYLIGLLHDLGCIALDSIPKYDYGQVLNRFSEGVPLFEAEREVYGQDNLQTWEQLAEAWNFPNEIISLRKSELSGKGITLSTARFTDYSSRMADTLGFYFIAPELKGTGLDFEIFDLLGEARMLEIRKSVYHQVNLVTPVLELPPPLKQETFRILWHISHDLQQSNIKYQEANQDLKSRVEVLQELTRVFTGIIKSLNGESLAFSILEALIEGFQIDGAFLLHNTKQGKLKGFSARGSRDEDKASVDQIVLDHSQIPRSIRKSLKSGQPVRVDDPTTEQMLIRALGDVSIAWISPIQVRGHITSILGLGVKEDGREKFIHEDFGKIVHIISGEIGLSIENSRLYNRMRKEARTDPLTSISNRRTIMSILSSEFARFKRKPFPLTVAIFDMDNFKAINDNRGHLAGDEFLIQISEILKSGMRESDYIGRYGGDEFIAVFPYTTPQAAHQVVERIRESVLLYCADFEGPDIGKSLSVSVGIAAADETMTHPDQLLKLADSALYQAKDLGRNNCLVYEGLNPTS